MKPLRLFILSCFLFIAGIAAYGQQWQDAKNTGVASVNVYWFTSKPFIFKDEYGHFSGVEYEILLEFKDFLKKRYDVNLRLNLVESESFAAIIDDVRKDKKTAFGASAFSITKERLQQVKFSNPYLSDVAVLVSSEGTPIVRTFEEINGLMQKMTSVTIKGTSYENYLQNIEKQLNINFTKHYIDSDFNILDEIKKGPNRFGYIDLAIYLLNIKQGVKLVRQNFFTVSGIGYAIMLPQASDWDEPLNEFFENEYYKKRVSSIISHHISPELYEFIESIYSGDHLSTSILTKEKELQLELIKQTTIQLEKEKESRMVLAGAFIMAVFLLTTIILLFYRNRVATRELIEQKKEIERQRENIRVKNDQLTNRNNQLTALNEEKNSLVRVLAHDLRSPIGQIMVMADVLAMSLHDLNEEDAEMLKQIKDGANRLNQMMTKILDFDALDQNRSNLLKEPIDVHAVAKDQAKVFKQQAAEKNITITLSHDKTNCIILADHLFITQIFENLLSNAVKFSFPNTRISIATSTDEDEVLIAIKDQGPGFQEDEKALVFQRYQKLSAKPTGGESSIGLGLSIVKKYVNMMGGDIWLESEIGKGATFFVRFPKYHHSH